MLRKILIVLGVLALVLVLGFVYLNYRNRTLSPPGKELYKKNDLTIQIDYNRPSVRNRLIFGAAADEALQPYGSYWRLGANEATEITINQDITFNGVPLKAGTYAIYAMPGAANFIIGINTETGRWGALEPDYTKDLFRTEVPVTHLDTPVEQFTTRITDGTESAAIVYFEWSDVQIAIPIGLN